MALQTTSNHSTIRTMYQKNYIEGFEQERLYDNFAGEVRDTIEGQGSSVTVTASTELVPRPTAAVGNETSDFSGQTLGEVTASISINYYNDGLKAHELAALESTFAVKKDYATKVGMNASQTIDALARRVATEGAIALYRGTNVTRVTLDLGTAGDRMKTSIFTALAGYIGEWGIPRFVDGSLMCVMTPWQFQDLISETGSPILLRQGYTDGGAKALFQNELAMLANVRIVSSRFAKVFYGAGAANASPVSTTIATTAVAAGAKTMTVAANTNITNFTWLHIGTVQTAGTAETDAIYKNEPVFVTGQSGTTITFVGRH